MIGRWGVVAAAMVLGTAGMAVMESLDRLPETGKPCICDPTEPDCFQKVFHPDRRRVKKVSCAIWNDGDSSCCVVEFGDGNE